MGEPEWRCPEEDSVREESRTSGVLRGSFVHHGSWATPAHITSLLCGGTNPHTLIRGLKKPSSFCLQHSLNYSHLADTSKILGNLGLHSPQGSGHRNRVHRSRRCGARLLGQALMLATWLSGLGFLICEVGSVCRVR